MKNVVGLIGLLVCFWACSRSNDDLVIDPDGPDEAKNVTALLNDETWYGRGSASKVVSVLSDACSVNKFKLGISNDLPYPKGARKSAAYICGGAACNTTQLLSFEKIPLAVGKYDIDSLNVCASYPLKAANYRLITGGDVIFASYQAESPDSGWIQVTKVDTVANVVEGAFELTLSARSGKSIYFRNGRFNVRMTR